MKTVVKKIVVTWSIGFLACTWAWHALACNVPVYRYMLQEQENDSYRATVFFDKAIPEDQANTVKNLAEHCRQLYGEVPKNLAIAQGKTCANLTLRLADVSGTLDPLVKELWDAQRSAATPWIVIRYPGSASESCPLWAGPLAQLNPAILLDSAARREIVQDLTNGETAVWVLLATGKTEPDARARQALEAGLRESEKTLTLPTPDAEDLKKARENKGAPALRVSFKTVVVSRADAGEVPFITMLLKSQPQLMKHLSQPIAIPIFARCRALPGLAGDAIASDQIVKANTFLTGPCACAIKDACKGVDMLTCLDWEKANNAPLNLAEPLPPLETLNLHPVGACVTGLLTRADDATISATQPHAVDSPAKTALSRNVLAALAAMVLVGAAGTAAVTIKRKS